MGGWLFLVQELYVPKFLRNRSALPSPLLIAVNFRNLTAVNPPSDPSFALRLRERIEHPFAILLTIFTRMLSFRPRRFFIFQELGCQTSAYIGIRQSGFVLFRISVSCTFKRRETTTFFSFFLFLNRIVYQRCQFIDFMAACSTR